MPLIEIDALLADLYLLRVRTAAMRRQTTHRSSQVEVREILIDLDDAEGALRAAAAATSEGRLWACIDTSALFARAAALRLERLEKLNATYGSDAERRAVEGHDVPAADSDPE